MKKKRISLKEEKEEKERLHKFETINILPNFLITKENILSEGMLEKQLSYYKTIKNSTNKLLGVDPIKRKKLLTIRKRRLKKTTIIGKNQPLPKDAVKVIIKKIGRNVEKIQKSITDITKMNDLFLEQKARKTISTYRLQKKRNNLLDNLIYKENNSNSLNNYKNKENKKENIKNNNNENNNDNNKYNKTQMLAKNAMIKMLNILKNKNSEKNLNLKKNNNNYLRNFLFVNENYRSQLNSAFLKYNPRTHLDNIKFLVEASPLIRKDILQIKKEVDEDIKWKCDKFHYKKKYETIKKEFQRSSSVQNTPKIPLKKISVIAELTHKKSETFFSPRISKKNYTTIFKKKKKEENMKFTFPKEEKITELNYMLKASSELNNLIKKENINDKINMYRTNYEQKKFKKNEKLNNNNNYINKNNNYFDEDEKKVLNALGNTYQFQIDKNGKERQNKIRGKIKIDYNTFKNKLKKERIFALNEINDIISDNLIL